MRRLPARPHPQPNRRPRPPPAGAPAPSPGPSLAELIYVELLGRAFLRVNDVATIKPDPASLAKLSMELADAFTNEKKAQLAALGPKNQGYDIKIDDPALISALATDAPYVGALGSRRSHAARRERLAAEGVSAAQIDRIDAPVGIDIGAIGPSEIALSIAAAMVGAFHDRR